MDHGRSTRPSRHRGDGLQRDRRLRAHGASPLRARLCSSSRATRRNARRSPPRSPRAGGRAAWAAADLRDDAATIAAVAAARRAFGRIDGLFAVAGGSGRRYGDGPLHEITLDGWNETMSLNGVPAFLAAREVIRAMLDLADDGEDSSADGSAARGGGSRPAADRGGGSIVLVTSVLASDPVPDLFATHAYAAIKGAEDALARTMAAYYAPHGIRVNSLAPGLVATPMSARAQADPTTAAYVEGEAALGPRLPAGRGDRRRRPLPALRRGALRHRSADRGRRRLERHRGRPRRRRRRPTGKLSRHLASGLRE